VPINPAPPTIKIFGNLLLLLLLLLRIFITHYYNKSDPEIFIIITYELAK